MAARFMLLPMQQHGQWFLTTQISSSSLVQAARISMLIQLQVSLFQKIRVPTGRQRNLIQIKPICQNRISQ
ncbi:hypothetical protein DXC61_06105 [Segatella copri]|uniref:Uncharacterized protein n=1 Tax=Segatella copri TaxID=165179 RepID=A0AA92VUK7_9BACT|nr:hypothetical protein DXC61_06105 [Segatella copri]